MPTRQLEFLANPFPTPHMILVLFSPRLLLDKHEFGIAVKHLTHNHNLLLLLLIFIRLLGKQNVSDLNTLYTSHFHLILHNHCNLIIFKQSQTGAT